MWWDFIQINYTGSENKPKVFVYVIVGAFCGALFIFILFILIPCCICACLVRAQKKKDYSRVIYTKVEDMDRLVSLDGDSV